MHRLFVILFPGICAAASSGTVLATVYGSVVDDMNTHSGVFAFGIVPEPATLVLVTAAVLLLARRRERFG